eukprot:1158352-Pelagomonas_calceolata.AAC.2
MCVCVCVRARALAYACAPVLRRTFARACVSAQIPACDVCTGMFAAASCFLGWLGVAMKHMGEISGRDCPKLPRSAMHYSLDTACSARLTRAYREVFNSASLAGASCLAHPPAKPQMRKVYKTLQDTCSLPVVAQQASREHTHRWFSGTCKRTPASSSDTHTYAHAHTHACAHTHTENMLPLDVGAHLDGLARLGLRHEEGLAEAGKLVVDHRLLQAPPICCQALVQGDGVTLREQANM